MAQPGVQFLYVPARDLAAMRDFYHAVIGLEERFYSEDKGLASYICGGFQFTIFSAPDAALGSEMWATQPGWKGTTAPATSWSVELYGDDFRQAVETVRGGEHETLHSAPKWVGYWSFPVKDPMRNTVELSWPDRAPKGLAWS